MRKRNLTPAVCPDCGAYGYHLTPGGSPVLCTTCGGTGIVFVPHEAYYRAPEGRRLCPTCGGAGAVRGEPCPDCGGQGHVPA